MVIIGASWEALSYIPHYQPSDRIGSLEEGAYGYMPRIYHVLYHGALMFAEEDNSFIRCFGVGAGQ